MLPCTNKFLGQELHKQLVQALYMCVSRVWRGTIPPLPGLGTSHHTDGCKIITDCAPEVFSGCKAQTSQSLALQCPSKIQCILVSVSLQAQQGA